MAEFQGGSKKGKSSNDDEQRHGQKKRRPSTYVEGKKTKSEVGGRGGSP